MRMRRRVVRRRMGMRVIELCVVVMVVVVGS
jgi:hypothetical protein